MKPALEIRDLVVSYWRPSRTLFNESPITLTLNKGDILCVTGSSGCGKSSLMDACLNNIENCKGSISFDPRRHTVQFNDNMFLQEKSFSQNLHIYLRVNGHKVKKEYFEKVYQYILKHENFTPDDPIKYCSFGTKRRIDLYLRLFEPEKKLYFLDEPTQGLDPYSVKRIMELIKEFHNEQTCFFIVTHEENLIQLATKVLILSQVPILIDEKDQLGLVKLKRSDWELLKREINLEDASKYELVTKSFKMSTVLLKTSCRAFHEDLTDKLKKNQMVYYQHWKTTNEPIRILLKVYFKT